MLALEVVGDNDDLRGEIEGVKGRIGASLDFILSCHLPSSNFPSRQGGGEKLVQWCHGAPGLIPTLALAYRVLGEQR